MSPELRQNLIGVIVIATIAAIGWGVSLNLEYVEEKDWRPLSGEARHNPLYASRLFLKGMGISTETVESLQSLTTLPDNDTVIIIDTPRYTQREEQLDDIITWVENGGHLIVRSVSDWELFDPDLSRPDEEKTEYSNDSAKISSDALQRYLEVHTGENIPFFQKEFQEIQLPNVDKKLKLGEDYYQNIELDIDNDKVGLSEVKVNDKNFIIQQRIGNGLITLVSDLSFIQNFSIDNFDHAEILWHLIHANTSSHTQLAGVWLIHSDDMPNLFTIIWNKFWPLSIMLGLLLLVWILRVSRRFGPMIPKDNEDRRNLMEHIEASGNYYWKQKQHAMLIDSTRASTQQRLIQRIPGWQAMNNDQQAKLLAERVSIKEQQILRLLHSDIGHNSHEFTEIIKQLEHIRTTV